MIKCERPVSGDLRSKESQHIVSSFAFGWNQINARAYDNAGNPSEVGYIWLYRVMEVFLPVSLR